MPHSPEPHPVSLWLSKSLNQGTTFGALYEDGSRKTLFRLDPANYHSDGELEDAVVGAYARCGIDADAINGWRSSQSNYQREVQEALEHLLKNSNVFGQAMPGSNYFRSRTYGGDVPGSAFGHTLDAFAYQMPPKPDPERAKAIVRCRSLKTLADHPTANSGERSNAHSAIERLKAKHSIRDSEI